MENPDILRIFYNSFRHSQGFLELEGAIFEWLAGEGYLQGVPEEPPEGFGKLSMPKGHIQRNPEAVNSRFREAWNRMHGKTDFRYGGFSPREIVTSVLTTGIINADLNYQAKKRPNRDGTGAPDGYQDPHASFFRRYALQGADAGHPAFNAMYGQAKETAQFGGIVGNLPRLATAWESNHPGELFLPQGLYSIATPRIAPTA
ncbi:MAG: hypothetical protein J4431_00570 [Candidatus Aenigmarchaeota archaeon]|nr:hypothetical protein [Candidatus Aenigmarchaeota archaeon]